MKSENRVEEFLQVLEGILKERNMSKPAFADLIDVPVMTVHKWLNREMIMGLEKYYRILEKLEIDETYIAKKRAELN